MVYQCELRQSLREALQFVICPQSELLQAVMTRSYAMNRICRNIYPPGTNAQYFSASAALLRRLMEASKRLPLSHERALLGAFMAVLDIRITNSSLRDITGGIAATQDEGSWVSTSYLIGEEPAIAF